MATYLLKLRVEGHRLDTVTKKAVEAFGNVVVVRKLDPSKSRADRLNDIAADVEGAATGVEELRDEIQEWLDNLPENLQQSDKGSELEDAIQALDELKDNLEGLDFQSVSFPSMM